MSYARKDKPARPPEKNYTPLTEEQKQKNFKLNFKQRRQSLAVFFKKTKDDNISNKQSTVSKLDMQKFANPEVHPLLKENSEVENTNKCPCCNIL